VMQTIGDKRLGTHLLGGLDLLLPLIVDEAALDASALLLAFPERRPREERRGLSTDSPFGMCSIECISVFFRL
jgi:hypothetical protein